MTAPEKVDCFKCRNFYVTWDPNFPRGCSVLGFKGREIPSRVVFNSSGVPCQYFEGKHQSKERVKGR
jgi:hypothetical protein